MFHEVTDSGGQVWLLWVYADMICHIVICIDIKVIANFVAETTYLHHWADGRQSTALYKKNIGLHE